MIDILLGVISSAVIIVWAVGVWINFQDEQKDWERKNDSKSD